MVSKGEKLTLILSFLLVSVPPPTMKALVPLIATTTVSFFSSAKTCPRIPCSFQPKESVCLVELVSVHCRAREESKRGDLPCSNPLRCHTNHSHRASYKRYSSSFLSPPGYLRRPYQEPRSLYPPTPTYSPAIHLRVLPELAGTSNHGTISMTLRTTLGAQHGRLLGRLVVASVSVSFSEKTVLSSRKREPRSRRDLLQSSRVGTGPAADRLSGRGKHVGE